ncbi:MAG TPA: hypothetical protein VES42_20140, partial [Pilimelia sp.]|nr:hypothetical protein [Pilimelia sp.]
SSTGGGTGGGTGTTAAGAAGDEGFTPVAGWCTNWSAYDVQALWKMVEPDNVCEGWNHVLAWQRVADAVNTQIGVLVDKQRQLAQLWPADANTAATAFMGRLDTLIATMRRTAAAAAATKTAMERINEELSSAQMDLRGYHEKYRSKSTDLIPSALDGAEDEVTKEARARSAKLEQAIDAGASTMVPVPVFISSPAGNIEPPGPREPGGSGGAGGGGVPASAVVPPIVHTPPSPLAGVDPVLPEGTQWTPGGIGPQSGADGPQLSGVNNLPPGAPGGGLTPGLGGPGLPPGGIPVGTPGGGLTPTPIMGMPTGGGTRGPTGVPGSGLLPGGPIGQPQSVSARPGASTGRPIQGVIGAAPAPGRPGGGIPPGGVIGGGAPGTGLIGAQPAGQGGASRAGTSRPAGTVSHGGMAGPTVGTPGSAMPMGAPGSGGRGRQQENNAQRDGDPDNPWAVREGGVPVIEPDIRPHRHDPGPGVIGG